MARKYGDALDTDADSDMDARLDQPLVFAAGDGEEPRGVGFAQLAGSSPVRVRVMPPFQVVHNTVVFRPGDVTEVPGSVAADWIRDGWVSPE
jgi:hypothetical protein